MLNSQSVVLIHLPILPLYVGSISSIGIRYHLLSHQTKQASSDNPRYWPVIFSPRIPGIVSLQVTSWPTGRRKRLGRGEYCPNRFLVLKHWNPNEPWRKYPGWLVTNQGLILYIYLICGHDEWNLSTERSGNGQSSHLTSSRDVGLWGKTCVTA
jgi:hypothetical protein